MQLPIFSGPFRLLADLILERRVDVCDVPVARITEAYLKRGLAEGEGWTLEEQTWFLATCALLVELKVGRLLPGEAALAEEDLVGGASPDLLYARSLELAAFRRLAGVLAERIDEASLMLARESGPPPELAQLYPDPMERVSARVLAGAAGVLLAPEPVIDLSHVAPIKVSLSDALAAIQARLAEGPEATFSQLLSDCEERIEVVVRFLAILELYREGKVELSQARVFGDIKVRWQGAAAPRTGDPGTGGDEREGTT